MDPYRILGVNKGCTREDLKAAFRAKVRLAHPDRGGDEQTFIAYCVAYKQLINKVRPGRTRRIGASDEAVKRAPPLAGRTGRQGHEAVNWRARTPRDPAPADSNWEPDIVLTAEVGRDGQPAPPPDSKWQAELVIHDDQALRESRPPQPPDPTFQPQVVILDGLAARDSEPSDPEPASTINHYRSMVERMAAGPADEDRVDWQNPWVRAIGLLVLILLVAAFIWLLWNASSDEPPAESLAPFSSRPSTP